MFRVFLWSGRFRLISRARGEEAMVGHVTPVNWPVPINRGPHWSPKRRGSWSSSSPRHHLDQTQLTRRPEPCNSAGHRQEGTPVCRHLRARIEVLRPRVVPVHTRRSQRDVEVLKQCAEKNAPAAREAQKRADRTAAAARRLLRGEGLQLLQWKPTRHCLGKKS